MAVINLRGVPDELAAALKAEAALGTVGFHEYCIAILELRGHFGLTVARMEGQKKIASVSGGAGAEFDRREEADFVERVLGGVSEAGAKISAARGVGISTVRGDDIGDAGPGRGHEGDAEPTSGSGGDIAGKSGVRAEGEVGGTPGLPGLGKTEEAPFLYGRAGIAPDFNKVHAPLVYKARSPGITDVNLGRGSICQLPEKIAPANPEGDWVGENRDIDPFNKEDVAAFQDRDRQAAAELGKTDGKNEPRENKIGDRNGGRFSVVRRRNRKKESARDGNLTGGTEDATKSDGAGNKTDGRGSLDMQAVQMMKSMGMSQDIRLPDSFGKLKHISRVEGMGPLTEKDMKGFSAETIAELRNICAGKILDSVGEPLTKEMVDAPDFGEVDLCGFKTYSEVDGEHYICGREKHGPKVKHGDWIKV